MQTVLVIVQLVVSIALVIVVLLQPSEGGALGIGGGGGGLGGLFSPRGAASTLTRTTAILAVVFFLVSMGLTIMALHAKPQASILDSAPAKTQPVKNPAQKPASQLPAVPTPQH